MSCSLFLQLSRDTVAASKTKMEAISEVRRSLIDMDQKDVEVEGTKQSKEDAAEHSDETQKDVSGVITSNVTADGNTDIATTQDTEAADKDIVSTTHAIEKEGQVQDLEIPTQKDKPPAIDEGNLTSETEAKATVIPMSQSTGVMDNSQVVQLNETQLSADSSDLPNTDLSPSLPSDSTPKPKLPQEASLITSEVIPTKEKPELELSFARVDELQVPFHDTDEAELSEILSKKPGAVTPETPDEGLQLYLEVESNQSDEIKDTSSNDTKDTPEKQSQEQGEPKIVPLNQSILSETENDTKKDLPVKSETSSHVNVTPAEKTEIDSFVKETENAPGTPLKEETGQSSELNTSSEDSPSKSEWCARKVIEGMKIVLKLKRKGSSDRGENSAPTTPTPLDQKQKFLPESKDVKIEKKEEPPKQASETKTVVSQEEHPSAALAEASSMLEDWKKKRKRRRNEVEMLSVTERPSYYKKRKNLDGEQHVEGGDMTDSEVSGFTSDSGSTLATQSNSIQDKEAMLKSLEQFDVPEVKVEDDLQEGASSHHTHQTTDIGPTPMPVEVTTQEPHQKVEKLVIKRRVPSPTKMKTRGKQNRLWYLFAKQSKPSKDIMMPSANKEPKTAPPRGTLEELKALCKPCSVTVVDLIKCLHMMSNETATSPHADQPEDLTMTKPLGLEGQGIPAEQVIQQAPLVSQTQDIGDETAVVQGIKRKRTAGTSQVQQNEASVASRTVTIPWPAEEKSPPSTKKTKLQAGSEYERQYLSFIMPQSTPAPVLDRSVRKPEGFPETVVKSPPKPVLTRAPVTARKSMKSAPRKTARKSGVTKKTGKAGGLSNEEMAGLHQLQTLKTGSPGAKFACCHCPYTSNVRSVMLEHVYIHTDAVPYACGHCSEQYGSRNGVVIHTKREHPGILPDIVKNTEICEEDYYITCDPNKRPQTDSNSAGLIATNLSHRFGAMEPPLSFAATSGSSGPADQSGSSVGKSVSLLNPAVLTAQVAATKVGLSSSTEKPAASSAPVQLVVTTSRPVSTAPVVNVVAQIDALANSHSSKEMSSVTAAAMADCSKRGRNSRRPRIPSLVNVDPSQPYYQCRHCTFANNNLISIKAHVDMQHKGEQRYQCHHCVTFFKSSSLVEKHYSKYHPLEQVVYQLQPDFYDVHQNEADKLASAHESMMMGQNFSGQSPLHVIVSPDGVTLLGATDVSPASSMASPQMSPSMSMGMRVMTSPVPPAHSRSQPMLSPTSHSQGPTPPPAHSGSPSPQPAKPMAGPAGKQLAPRVILRVPTISPPQRSPGLPSRAPAAAHISHDPATPQSQLLLHPPMGSSHSTPSAMSEDVEILNLTTSSSDLSPGLDLSKKATNSGPDLSHKGIAEGQPEVSAADQLDYTEVSRFKMK